MSGIQTRPLEINDFSGGITDNYVGGALNESQVLDNVLINSDKRPYSRPGSTLLDSAHPQLPTGAQRVGTLFNFSNDRFLLAQSGRRVYYKTTTGWKDIVGPSGALDPLFTSGDTTNTASFAAWNKHVIATHDGFPAPMKIFQDATTEELKTVNAGLPKMLADPTITLPAGAGTKQYIYAFVYAYTYQVGTLTTSLSFIDLGPTRRVQKIATGTATDIGGGTPCAITNINAIVSGLENYDTANIVTKIYRSTNNGTTLYYVGQVANGVTTFNDSVPDATLVNNEVIYTTGGIRDNDPAPRSKFCHIAGDIAIYGHIQEGSETLGNRIRQAVPGDIDSCPADFYDDFEEDLVGASSFNGTFVVFGDRGAYRLDGTFDEQGRGGITHKKIDDSVGCVSHQGIVQTSEGIFFPGQDGFYWTDGFKVQKISDGFNDTYKQLVDSTERQRRIVGTYDEKERMVHWAVSRAIGLGGDNDSIFTFHLRFGIKPKGCFTTWSGGTNFAPTSLCYFQKTLMRGDTRGYVFKHETETLTDPKVNTGVTPSSWITSVVVYTLTSAAFNFGSSFGRYWVPRMTLQAVNETNLSLQIISTNDTGRQIKELVPIKFRGNITWGDDDVTWGDATLVWDFEGLIEDQRRFPAGSMRCSYKQITLTNAEVITSNSDLLGKATVDATAKTAMLPGPTIWPTQPVDQYISFAQDSYARSFLITARTNDTLTFEDTDGFSPTGLQGWQISGMPKDERLHLLSYVIHYAPLSKTQDMYHSKDSGANA